MAPFLFSKRAQPPERVNSAGKLRTAAAFTAIGVDAAASCAVRILATLAFAVAASAAGITVHLSEQTRRGFDSSVQAAESAMQWQPNLDPKSGEVQVAPWAGATPVAVEDGLIHDWVAAVQIPGASVEQALKMFQRYEDYPSIFPGVIESRVLSQQGNRWLVYLRLRRKNVLTVVLDADHQIEYRPLEDGKWAIISSSGPISEVENGKPLPADTGNGFLWRLNAYWLLAPRAGGLYIECRTISLSRDIPAGLGWLIKPMVSGVPRESLRQTMEAARRTLR